MPLTLTTPFYIPATPPPDFGSPTYSGNSFTVTTLTGELSPTGIFFHPDGSSMFFTGFTQDRAYELNMSPNWDITSFTLDPSFATGVDTSPNGIFLSPDGLKMFIAGDGSKAIHQYSLSSAYNLASPTLDGSFDVSAQTTFPRDVFFKPDGTKMYVAAGGGGGVYQYALATPWVVTSGVTFETSYTGFGYAIEDAIFSSDGTRMYVAEFAGNNDLYQFELGTAWDVSTAGPDGSPQTIIDFDTLIGVAFATPTSMKFSPDETKLYVMARGNRTVYEIIL